MATIASLIVNIAADTAALRRDLERGVGDVQRFADKASGAITGGLKFTAVAAAATAAWAAVKDLADEAERIDQLATRLSTTAEAAQRLAHATEEAGGDVGTLVGHIDKLAVRLGEGEAGAAAAMRRLNLNIDEFLAMPVEEKAIALANAFGEIEDRNVRLQIGNDLLGKSYSQLAGVLTTDLKIAFDEAAVMSDRAVQNMKTLGDEVDGTWKKIKFFIPNLIAAFQDASGIINETFNPFGSGRLPFVPPPGMGGPDPNAPRRPALDHELAIGDLLTDQLEDRKAINDELERYFAMLEGIRRTHGAIEFSSQAWAEATRMAAEHVADWADVAATKGVEAAERIAAAMQRAVVANALMAEDKVAQADALMQRIIDAQNATENVTVFTGPEGMDPLDQEGFTRAQGAALALANLELLAMQKGLDGVNERERTMLDVSKQILGVQQGIRQAMTPEDLSRRGLAAPTAEQVATGRYFGPVTASGAPDLSRLGGAAPINVTVNGALSNDRESFKRVVSESVMEALRASRRLPGER